MRANSNSRKQELSPYQGSLHRLAFELQTSDLDPERNGL